MSKMVTGANQDINHNGKVFHVQTEDRGEESGIIETLVYTGGEILHSRRSTYMDEMKANGYDAKHVATLLERQHRRIVLEIRQGRFDPPGTAPQPFAFATSGKRPGDGPPRSAVPIASQDRWRRPDRSSGF